MKKKVFLCFLITTLISSLAFTYSENGNGYPASYDSGVYGGSSDNGNGGNNNGNNSGNNPDQQGAPTFDTEGEQITSEANQLNSEVTEQQSEIDSISSGDGENINTGDAVAAEESLQTEVADSIAGTEADISENVDSSTEENNSSNSLQTGDPVKISRGTYFLSENDIVIGCNKLFTIKRTYNSDCKITGSFGTGWNTNLDERIILGTRPAHHNDIRSMNDYVNKLIQLITLWRKKLESHYCVTDVYNAQIEINNRIASCENHISELNDLISKLEKLTGRANYRIGLKLQIGQYIENARSVKKSAEDKKQELEMLYEQSLIDIEFLQGLEIKLNQAQIKLDEMKKLMQEDIKRNIRNQRVLFSGMEKFYEETGLDTITVIDSDGYPHILNEEGALWENKKDKLYKYCEKTDDGFLLYEWNGTEKIFNEDGFLIYIKDRNGNTVEIVRNTEDKILCIKTSDNECFEFEYENRFISNIKNSRSNDETVIYRYKGNKLISVTDSDGDTVVMNYDSDNHIVSLLKCDGSLVQFRYGEQNSEGKILITETINEEGASEFFEYNINDKKTLYTDHDGNKYTYFYDDRHRTVEEYHPDGTVIKNEYDDFDNLITANTNGSIVRYEYDERRNKIRSSYEDGSNEKWEYDNFGFIIFYSNRDGVEEEFVRDSFGRLITYRKGGKTVYTQELNAKGQIIRKTINSEQLETIEYFYDSFGNLIKEICDGICKEYFYDNRNRLKKYSVNGFIISEYTYGNHEVIRKNYNGLSERYKTNGRKDITHLIQKDEVTGEIHQLRIEYDKRHLPLKVFMGEGEAEKLIIECSYTAEGKLSSEILYGAENIVKDFDYKNGIISEIRQYKENEKNKKLFVEKYDYQIRNKNQKSLTVSKISGITELFEYDSFGNLIKKVDGNGDVRLSRFSRAGLLSSKQSEYGGWYEYYYGTDGNLIAAGEQGKKQIKYSYYPDGKVQSVKDRCGEITEYHYDKQGRISCIQRENQKIWYEYDFLGRIIKKICGPSSTEESAVNYISYAYSSDGRTVIITEGGKYKTTQKLDAFGNVIKVLDGNNNERSFVYNSFNQIVESIDGYGNKTLYEYDALGNAIRKVLPEKSEINYKYNCLGLIEEVNDECGLVYKADYDGAGRRIKEKKRAECEQSYEYDNAGRLLKILKDGDIAQRYDYSDKGRTVSFIDGNQNKYLYYYDLFGRLVREKNRNDNFQIYSYDEEGFIISKKDFADKNININYSSDKTSKTFLFADASENQFFYDSIGNILWAQNEYGRIDYSYDQGGRLIYQKDSSSGEENHYEYDNAGNRTTLFSSSRETKYVYGKNNEIIEIFDNKQKLSVKLDYDKNGREILRKYGNGTKEETLYDKAGRVIVKMLKSGRNELLWGEGYVYDSEGKRTAAVDNNARITFYEYNKKGQLSTIYYPYSDEIINSQKREAEENGLPVIAAAGENRFLSSSEKNSVIPLLNSMQYGLAFQLTDLQILIKESYSYDLNGNRISKSTSYGTIEYTFDKENCILASGSRGLKFIKYTSDKMGNLLSEESPSKKVSYSYNAQNRLAYCESQSFSDKEFAQTSYSYDAFGRRVLVQDKNQTAIRTTYDGLSFDVVKQDTVYEKEGLSNLPTGDRYRYLDDDAYKGADNSYYGERTQFYVNGNLAAQRTSDSEIEYFTTDQQGSVRFLADCYGMKKSDYSYDAFGTLIYGNLSRTSDNGYLGKSFEQTSKLYNYGYRDYKTDTSRFTTIDPIRDGSNWFAYCNGDPVNFVDIDGLFFYSASGQHSITENKQTTVVIIRNNDGLGNSFDSTRYIYKNDGINTKLVYADTVGANCKEQYYTNGTGFTTPDGDYYLSSETVTKQDDGTYNSLSYRNVLALKTNDQTISEEKRDDINTGDRLLHANEKNGTIYTENETPEGAGCIIGKDGQSHQDEMMAALMDGVDNPSEIVVKIRSLEHIEGCGK